jgi:hypothetical protein
MGWPWRMAVVLEAAEAARPLHKRMPVFLFENELA